MSVKAYLPRGWDSLQACLNREHFATISTQIREDAVPKLANCEIHREHGERNENVNLCDRGKRGTATYGEQAL